jgi:hypothetical protein
LEKLIEERNQDGITLRLHKLDDQIGAVLDAIHSCGGSLVDLHTMEASLEDVFLDLTYREQERRDD